jgi:acyl phosphate:glycerol-3-phosphate acyltransferase
MEILLLIVGIIQAYLLGSVPTSVWIGKSLYNVDVRSKGSGNAGATNTIRVLGLKAGIPVLLFDVFKGWLAVYLSDFFATSDFSVYQLAYYNIIASAAAVTGHVFPVFAGFKGGKGIATLLGVGIALYPEASLTVFIIFIIIFLITRYVSVASIAGSVSFPFLVIFLFQPDSIPLILLAVAVGIFVPITHRNNIKRLLNGTESRFSLKRKKPN